MLLAQQIISQEDPLFENIYITLDDNAQYGLNIREAQKLKDLVTKYNLGDIVKIYPGADEVPFLNV